MHIGTVIIKECSCKSEQICDTSGIPAIDQTEGQTVIFDVFLKEFGRNHLVSHTTIAISRLLCLMLLKQDEYLRSIC